MDAGLVVNAASGLPLVLLGVYLLARPGRSFNRIFAAFAVAWGVQVAVTNLAAMSPDASTAARLYAASVAFLVLQYVFLAYFASIFPRRSGPLASSSPALALALLPAGAAVALLAFAPGLILAGVVTAGDSHQAAWGPLAPYLVHLPRFGALYFALFVLHRASGQELARHEKDQARLMLAGLGVFAAFITVHDLAQALADWGAFTSAMPASTMLAYLALFSAGVVALAGVGVRLARSGDARLASLALLLPGAWGLASALPPLSGVPLADAAGLWRLVAVGVIVYAIQKYQLFDLDLKVRRAAPAGVALGVALVSLPLLLPRDGGWTEALVPALAACGLGLAAGLGSRAVVERVWPDPGAAGEALYRRKLEVYQASVVQLLREGQDMTPADRGWLTELQRSLGLSDRERRVLESLARVSVTRDSQPEGLRPRGLPEKYVVQKPVGGGSFSRVFLATDRTLERRVVIKQLLAPWSSTAALRATFLREARIAAGMQHPNIVRVFDVVEAGPDLFMVMEHVAGGSLHDRLGREGKLPPDSAAGVLLDVLAALAALHERRILHRDVKPSNVLLDGNGRAKLSDFGVAHTPDEDPSLTSLGLTPGTPHFMSPEQALGSAVDARSDLYAAAALFHLMVTGRHYLPFNGCTATEVRRMVALQAPVIPVPDQPAWVNAFLARGLEKDARRRFQSAAEMARSLREHARAPLVARTVMN